MEGIKAQLVEFFSNVASYYEEKGESFGTTAQKSKEGNWEWVSG